VTDLGCNPDTWHPLRAELERWERAGETVRLWLRDDDAIEVTPALRRLLDLTTAHRVPALLAVIPAQAQPSLSEFLEPHAIVEVGVHGFQHANHAPAGEKAEEFTPDRDPDEVLRELRSGLDRLRTLFGAKCLPLFVPPWNRISRAAASSLPVAGYRALSTFGGRPLLEARTGLIEVNTHLDIIDWRGTRGGRDPGWLALELASELGRARERGYAPVGVLTHHLVHDAAAWGFLDCLFSETARHRIVHWVAARDLVA
jgi:hypothetical protein